MQTSCSTCDAPLPLEEHGKYAGNCHVCSEIYLKRDANENHEQSEANAGNWIGFGFAAYCVARIFLILLQWIIQVTAGIDLQYEIGMASSYMLIVPMATLVYGVYLFVTLKNVPSINLAAPAKKQSIHSSQ